MPAAIRPAHGSLAGGNIGDVVATHGETDALGPLMLVPTRLAAVSGEPERFPPEPIRSLGAAPVSATVPREDDPAGAGRRADPLTRFVGGLPRRPGDNVGAR